MWMEVSGQPRAPAPSPPGKSPRSLMISTQSGPRETVWTCWRSSTCARIRNPDLLARSLVTVLTWLSCFKIKFYQKTLCDFH